MKLRQPPCVAQLHWLALFYPTLLSSSSGSTWLLLFLVSLIVSLLLLFYFFRILILLVAKNYHGSSPFFYLFLPSLFQIFPPFCWFPWSHFLFFLSFIYYFLSIQRRNLWWSLRCWQVSFQKDAFGVVTLKKRCRPKETKKHIHKRFRRHLHITGEEMGW